MAEHKPSAAPGETFEPSQGYHALLRRIIGQATDSPSSLRNLVYAFARQTMVSGQTDQAAASAGQPLTEEEIAALEQAIQELEADLASGHRDRETMETVEESDVPERRPAPSELVTMAEGPRDLDAEVIRPKRSLPVAEPIIYVPLNAQSERRAKFSTVMQLAAASVCGIVLYIGVSSWIVLHQGGVGSAPPASAAAPAVALPTAPEIYHPQPAPPAKPEFPFPLPRSYGVYAAANNTLFPLDQLPIKAPVARVQLSAEIRQPSHTTVPAKVAFIVYRRDLVASAPLSVSARVVARVTRSMKFVGGKAIDTPLQDSWRIRDKSYEFQVVPVESNREMIVVQPDPTFEFPPGRYALVLNGFAYDFTVAGQITAPEQCLEQTEITDGAIVTECPKKS